MDIKLKVIITKKDDLFYGSIPNFTLFEDGSLDLYSIYGETLEECLNNVKEVAILDISDLINENKDIPIQEDKIKLKENQFISYIYFNFEYELAKTKQILKNKTVVIPVWLDLLAQKQKINFSQILQKALKKELKLLNE